MPDMLVKLYELPELAPALAPLSARGIAVRPALAPEKPRVVAFTDAHFPHWTPEVEVALQRSPVTCLLATGPGGILGFACYDATRPNFFGPTGVLEAERGSGIGKALLLAALHAQRAQGYAYAIIGGAGPVDFYARAVGATVIEGSVPGIYAGMLR